MKKIQKLWYRFLKMCYKKLKSNTTLLDLKIKLLEYDFLIGVIGHRELLKGDCKYLDSDEIDRKTSFYKQIENKIDELIKVNEGKKIALISPLAKGADQLVAQVARDKNLEVICVLPFMREDYIKVLSNKTELTEENSHQFNYGVETDKAEKKWIYLPTSASLFFEGFEKGSSYVIVDSEIAKLSRNLSYELVGKFITLNCDNILFLWDGVYTGGQGGTSESYHLAVGGFCFDKNFTRAFKIRNPQKRILHHLSTPKADNPYPVGKRYTNSGKECFADYSKVYTYLWHTEEINNPIENFKKNNKRLSGDQSLLRNRFFWAYMIPFFFGLLMFLAWAFSYYDKMGSYNGFWANTKEFLRLLKMPGGNLESDFPYPSYPENIAIALGIFVFIYVLAVTLIYTLSNDRRILATRIGGCVHRRYNLILGLGWKGMELAQNLKCSSQKKVVVVDKNELNENTKWALRNGIRVIKGNFLNADILTKIGWQNAQDIYIQGDNDETNIRALQLLDSQIKYSKKPRSSQKIGVHVHLDDFRNKYFLSKSLQNSSHLNLNCFNIYENAIRRILLKHPLDRFFYNTDRKRLKIADRDTVKVVILGYNNVAQALFRNCFTHCIYEADKKVAIEVYIENEQDIEFIKKDIPYVFKFVDDGCVTNFIVKGEPDSVSQYVYRNFIVCVRKLPQTEYSILKDAEYITSIKQNVTTSIFACIDDGLRSTAYLSAILPALEVKKQCEKADVQAYCYFNFPEERDNSFIEESINKIAKTIPVFYFGNFAEELTEAAIKNHEQDELAKMINFTYYVNFQYKEEKCLPQLDKKIDDKLIKCNFEINTPIDEKIKNIGTLFSNKENFEFKKECLNLAWNSLDEFKKESNRIAADHVFVKLRYLSVYIASENKNLIPSNIWEDIKTSVTSFKLKEGLLYTLSELEHRRWCAERIFYGWDYFHDNIPDRTKWKKLKEPVYEPLKNHIDMLPFDTIHKDEQRIDMVLIENLGLIFEILGKYKTYSLNQNNQF